MHLLGGNPLPIPHINALVPHLMRGITPVSYGASGAKPVPDLMRGMSSSLGAIPIKQPMNHREVTRPHCLVDHVSNFSIVVIVPVEGLYGTSRGH